MDFSQIKNILGGVLENVTEKGKEYAGVAKDKTRSAGRIAKLSVELASEKEALKKAYAELGKAYYDECSSSAVGVFAQLCEEITAVSGRIETMQAEIAQLKESLAPATAEADFEDVVAKDECGCECGEAPEEECSCQCDGDITVEIVEETADEAPAEETPDITE